MHIPASGVFRELWDTIKSDASLSVPTLPESALPFLLSRIPAPQSGRSVVVVLSERRNNVLSDLQRATMTWQRLPVEVVPPSPLPLTILPILLPQERSGDIPTPRLRTFWQIVVGLLHRSPNLLRSPTADILPPGLGPRLILTTTRELEQRAPGSLNDLGGFAIREGQELSLTSLAARLVDCGYSEETVAEEPGTFARRGGIVDVFLFAAEAPLRLDYRGDTIDRISVLGPRGNNGTPNGPAAPVMNAVIPHARDAEPPQWTIYPLHFGKKLSTTLGSLLDRAYVIAEEGTLQKSRRVDLTFTTFTDQPLPLRAAPTFEGNLDKLRSFVREKTKSGEEIFLLTSRPVALAESLPSHDRLTIVPTESAETIHGFSHATDRLHLLTDGDLGELTETSVLPWDTGMAYARRFRTGDIVVHRDHGIARFRGIERRTFEESARDYLVLEYAQRDRLYVPVELASKVTAYIGAANPVVHRLGGIEWETTTRAIRTEATDLARELLALYAARETEGGTSYPPDTKADETLAASFPFRETPDQAAAIREVKLDMERAQPMDRLVCGDVGFGKTEVAIRASFKAVNFGRQVVVLSPTTLLAQQHYDTFRERLAGMDANVALLSRLQTPAEEGRILRGLAEGTIHIVIGTHRLLSDDIHLKNLGLLIIDEEQKFGVAQKEQLKRLRSSVDVLSLSATPIPRTLHMALSNLRSLSVIATAPTGRRPVITKVAREQDTLVQKALEEELARGGQAYVLWNRVETIEAFAGRLRSLLPKARVVVAHGQMPETDLMRVMESFDTRHADVLVCSTIIENGIDLPNVNTLVVFDATNFGLSDLYQLRGRVGRGNQQAYAYFLYNQGRLPFEARKRLAALLEAVELGSGWTLALRDLEIRGAGNLLGREQHGTIRAIGVHLFGELLAEEVEKLRAGETAPRTEDVHVDLPLKAFLPETYIPNADARLATYARLSAARTPDDIQTAEKDLATAYGPLPLEARAFLELLRLKFLAVDAGIASLSESNAARLPRDGPIPENRLLRRTTLTFREGLTPELAYAAIADNPRWTFTGSSMFIPTAELLADKAGGDLLEPLKHILRVLAATRRKEAKRPPAKK